MTPLEVKVLVRERDGNRCTECGMDLLMHLCRFGTKHHVHRIIPGSEYTIDGCVTLCQDCHKGKPKSLKGSRKRKFYSVPIPAHLAEQVVKLANHWCISVSAVVNIALAEYLARQGLWPPKRNGE